MKFAELELYKLPSTLDASSNSTVTIQIDDIYNGKRVSSHLVSMETTGWINFTIPLDVIRRWKRNPASNAGLAVNINESNVAPAIRFATRQTHPSLQLLLLLHCINTENRLPDEVLNVPIEATAQQRKPRSVIASHTHTQALADGVTRSSTLKTLDGMTGSYFPECTQPTTAQARAKFLTSRK